MNGQQWNEGLNNIDPTLVEEHIRQQAYYAQKRRRRNRAIQFGAMAACLCVILGTVALIAGLEGGVDPTGPIIDINTSLAGPITSSTDVTTSSDGTEPTEPVPSTGLLFTLSSDGESYAVSGIGTCQDTDIVIPQTYEGLPVTTITAYAFGNFSAITSVTIPEGVTTIEKYAFYFCTNLQTVIIPEGVTTIESAAFAYCWSLTDIIFPSTLQSIGTEAFRECKSLTSVVLPDGLYHIGGKAFRDCENLTQIVIPDSAVSIGGVIVSGTAYYNDESNWENGLLYIGNQLIQAKTDISGEYTVREGTKSIADAAFEGCEALTAIDIPDSVEVIGWYAFADCVALTEVALPEGLREIDEKTFLSCTSLTHIILPDSVESIGDEAFGDCYSLVSVTIGGNLTSLEEYAFYLCDSLTDIYFGGTMEQWEACKAGEWANLRYQFTVHCTDGDITA